MSTTEAIHTSGAVHEGPHILATKGESIHDWSIFGLHITTTVFSTWIFMIVLFGIIALLFIAIRTEKFPKIKTFGLDMISRLREYLTSLLDSKTRADTFMWLLGGLFILIFFGNIFGLLLDWFSIVFPHLHTYLRPIYSDMSTTVIMSTTIILIAQAMGIYMKGPIHHFAHYLWNANGNNAMEKGVNVFVGWLHFVGEFIRVFSLSLRLFLNIFIGALLISIMVYIGNMVLGRTGIGQILVLPFWFFELLVAFLQAYIFMTLSALYLKESYPED